MTVRRMTGAERREQLLDVTKDLVGAGGLHAISIEAVARAAGITRPVVYAHFDSLPALLEAMLERESARALAQLASTLPAALGDPSPGEALLAALDAYLRTVAADPVTWRLALVPPEGAPEALRAGVARGRAAVVAMLEDFVSTGRLPGPPSPDPHLTARTLSALADESARLMLDDPTAYPPERLVEHARWLLSSLL